MLLCAIVFVPFQTSVGAVILFLGFTYFTLLFGHSVGMHRALIHKSFECPKWLERILVYLGVLVGMAGPFGILKIHDVRDWAQREAKCHDFFAHRRSLLVDAFWQLNSCFHFDHPPTFIIEPAIKNDRWYQWFERTWMIQQIPIGIIFYFIGGWPWVVWGICVRVTVSNAGHWIVTYVTHNPGPGSWLIPNAGVQASNLPGYGFITMGECWHNNHHAFPESARMGLSASETDPGWWVIKTMNRLGLVSKIGRQREASKRGDVLYQQR